MSRHYFTLLSADLRRYFSTHYLDPIFNTIWYRLPAFNYLEGNYTYDVIIQKAIKCHYTQLAQILLLQQQFAPTKINVFYDCALQHSCIPMLTLLLEQYPKLALRRLNYLAPTPEVIEWLQLTSIAVKLKDAILVLIRSGQIALLRQVESSRSEFNSWENLGLSVVRDNYIEAAIASNSPDMFRLIVDRAIVNTRGLELPHMVTQLDVIDHIIVQANLPMLQLALDHYRWPVGASHLTKASLMQLDSPVRREIMTLLRQRGSGWDMSTLLELTRMGDLTSIKLLLNPQQLASSCNHIAAVAVIAKQMEILNYLQEQCEQFQPEVVVANAIKYGSVAIAQHYYSLAHSRGFRLTAEHFHAALRQRDNLALVQWLHQLKCPVQLPLLLYTCMNEDRHRETLEFLSQHYPAILHEALPANNQYDWTAVVNYRNSRISVACYQWLFEHHIEMPPCAIPIVWLRHLARSRSETVTPTELYQLDKHIHRESVRTILADNDSITLSWLVKHSDLRERVDTQMVEMITTNGYLTGLKLLWPVKVPLLTLERLARKHYAKDIIDWLQQAKTKRKNATIATVRNKKHKLESKE